MRCQIATVKASGDKPETGALASLFVDHVLRKVEAAAALHVAADAGVRRFRRGAACASGLADLGFGQRQVAFKPNWTHGYTNQAPFASGFHPTPLRLPPLG